MSNTLRIKLGLLIFSIIVLALIPLLKSNFNATVTISKWHQLTWDDFQGFVRPFSRWGAVINSNVYVEYDSASNSYYAYAGQNNQLSWVKSKTKDSDYALNHEQYHFNLTEYHARLMNKELTKHKDLDESQVSEILARIRANLSIMQDQYDEESDHGLIESFQSWWEFRIDSLLLETSIDEKFAVDHFSGASAFFPKEPHFAGGVSDDIAYRSFIMKDYNVELKLLASQLEIVDASELRGLYREFFVEDLSLDLIHYSFDSLSPLDLKWSAKGIDSTKTKIYKYVWQFNGNYLYGIASEYPYDSNDTLGYELLSDSFINSFHVQDVSNYWISQFDTDESKIYLTPAVPMASNDDSETKCATYAEQNVYGFYAMPIYLEDGSIILPYEITAHTDSLINEVLLIYDGGGIRMKKQWGIKYSIFPKINFDQEKTILNLATCLNKIQLISALHFITNPSNYNAWMSAANIRYTPASDFVSLTLGPAHSLDVVLH